MPAGRERGRDLGQKPCPPPPGCMSTGGLGAACAVGGEGLGAACPVLGVCPAWAARRPVGGPGEGSPEGSGPWGCLPGGAGEGAGPCEHPPPRPSHARSRRTCCSGCCSCRWSAARASACRRPTPAPRKPTRWWPPCAAPTRRACRAPAAWPPGAWSRWSAGCPPSVSPHGRPAGPCVRSPDRGLSVCSRVCPTHHLVFSATAADAAALRVQMWVQMCPFPSLDAQRAFPLGDSDLG